MKLNSPISEGIPLDMTGSTKFGRYPVISLEQTFNMIKSDGWSVPYAGYRKVSSSHSRVGRGIYASVKLKRIVLVSDNKVFITNPTQTLPFSTLQEIGVIDTFNGDVFITENNKKQIAICDKQNLYIYDYAANTFGKIKLDFIPAHISFQNGRFIAAVKDQPIWRLSDFNDGFSWPALPAFQGTFQSKPDVVVATVPLPGKSNVLLVIGKTVTEVWVDVGAQNFPYQRNSYFNINYGCLNAATIADNGEFVSWLASNEKSGPTIIYTNGGPPQQISNDGIDFKLASLKKPQNAYGFMFLQDGHPFYQITFTYDDFSYSYDFKEKCFYSVTNENQGHHIAKSVVFFNNSYYFISFNGGDLYEFGSNFYSLDKNECPRIRVCNPIRLPDSSTFIVNNVSFWIEQGQGSFSRLPKDNVQRIDFSISKDGGETFSNYIKYDFNPVGVRKSKINFWNLGLANEFIFQFRFYGLERFVLSDGLVSIYQ